MTYFQRIAAHEIILIVPLKGMGITLSLLLPIAAWRVRKGNARSLKGGHVLLRLLLVAGALSSSEFWGRKQCRIFRAR
jgi:hypothetical protein